MKKLYVVKKGFLKHNVITLDPSPVQEVKVARVGSKVHEGVCFRYRCTPGSATAAATWQDSLGQLSGGERTLTCLAFILAVSQRIFVASVVMCLWHAAYLRAPLQRQHSITAGAGFQKGSAHQSSWPSPLQ